MNSLTHSLIHLLIHTFIDLLINSLTYSSVLSFVNSPSHLFVHSTITEDRSLRWKLCTTKRKPACAVRAGDRARHRLSRGRKTKHPARHCERVDLRTVDCSERGGTSTSHRGKACKHCPGLGSLTTGALWFQLCSPPFSLHFAARVIVLESGKGQ